MIMHDTCPCLVDCRCACLNHPKCEFDIVVPVHIGHFRDTTGTLCESLREGHIEPVAVAEPKIRRLLVTRSPEEHEI